MKKIKLGQKLTVKRFLTTDPANKRGQKGTVIKIDTDIVQLKFEDGKIGMYTNDRSNFE